MFSFNKLQSHHQLQEARPDPDSLDTGGGKDEAGGDGIKESATNVREAEIKHL